jgi:hypothetical protein
MITNFELEDLAVKHKIPLVGVYSKDQLPKFHKDGGYIVNLQDSEDEKGKPLPGTHWCAFYVEGKNSAYFDSFGFQPPVSVCKYLEKRYNVVVSEKQIQSVPSEVCGWYCLYFIWFMDRHKKTPPVKRFYLFLKQFSDNPTKNLTILKKLLEPV